MKIVEILIAGMLRAAVSVLGCHEEMGLEISSFAAIRSGLAS